MRNLLRWLVGIFIMLGALLLLSNCGTYHCGVTFGASTCTPSGSGISGGGGSQGQASLFAYFVSTSGLAGAVLTTSGNFGLIPNFTSPPYPLSGGSVSMVIVQKQWIYVPRNGTLAIDAFSLNSTTGDLSLISGQPFSTPDDYTAVSDPLGKYLFVCGAQNDDVTVFAINQTSGALTLVGSYSTGIGFAAQATTDGLGKFLYVTAGNLGSAVAAFSIGSNGSLTPIAGSPFSISIAELRGERTGQFLLGITGNGANNGVASDNHIYVYSINQTTGAPTPLAGTPFATTYIPGHLQVHPNGLLVYTFNYTVSGSSPMEGFQFNSTNGALTALSVSPFTSFTPYDGRFDQAGDSLFLHSLNTIAATTIDTTTGALTSVGQPLSGTGDVAWGVTQP